MVHQNKEWAVNVNLELCCERFLLNDAWRRITVSSWLSLPRNSYDQNVCVINGEKTTTTKHWQLNITRECNTPLDLTHGSKSERHRTQGNQRTTHANLQGVSDYAALSLSEMIIYKLERTQTAYVSKISHDITPHNTPVKRGQ